MADPTTTAAAPPPAEAKGLGEGASPENMSLETVYDIPVQVTVMLGKTSMQVNQLLKLGRGAVIELDKKVGEPIDIFVNNRLVARGEVVVVEDRIGVTMTEIIKADKH
jgi:flagellar motor switch protein FliN